MTSPSALSFARLLGEGPMARVALEALLNELDAPAFIASVRGTILHSNHAGNSHVRASADGLRGRLAGLIAGRCDSSELVSPLRCADGPTYYLIVLRPPSPLAATLDTLASLWELTPRQSEVLALLSEGFGNKTIAVRLRCAERTVETHVTAIFKKAGYNSRTELLAELARQARAAP